MLLNSAMSALRRACVSYTLALLVLMSVEELKEGGPPKVMHGSECTGRGS